MPISLKKQIHQTKILNLIKTHDIVLFFAILNLPQKNRQLLKQNTVNPLMGLVQSTKYSRTNTMEKLCLRGSYNNFPKNPTNIQGVLEKQGFLQEPPFFKNNIKTQRNSSVNLVQALGSRLDFKTKSPLISSPEAEANMILHISNKCAKHLDVCYNLPLSGHTLMFAVQEENAQSMLTFGKSFYKGLLLAGFYKKRLKTRNYIKALSSAIFRKKDIYSLFCKVFFFTSYNQLNITFNPCRKYLVLCKYIKKN